MASSAAVSAAYLPSSVTGSTAIGAPAAGRAYMPPRAAARRALLLPEPDRGKGDLPLEGALDEPCRGLQGFAVSGEIAGCPEPIDIFLKRGCVIHTAVRRETGGAEALTESVPQLPAHTHTGCGRKLPYLDLFQMHVIRGIGIQPAYNIPQHPLNPLPLFVRNRRRIRTRLVTFRHCSFPSRSMRHCSARRVTWSSTALLTGYSRRCA